MQRLSARVRLDDSPSALAHAEAEAVAGDESWAQWLVEYRRGEALIVWLEMTAELFGGELVHASSSPFFIERDIHPPKVEQQIAEVAGGDITDLARTLRAGGHEIDLNELAEMYVHVELDSAVRDRLRTRGGQTPAA